MKLEMCQYLVAAIIWSLCVTAANGCKTSAITYNLGLLDSMGVEALARDPSVGIPPSRTARRDAIIEQLKKPKNRADFLCLQEVWYGEDVYKITEDLKQSYPYAYSAVHGPGCNGIPDEGYSETPPCPLAEFEVLGACMIKRSCTKQQTISWVVGCIFLNCLTELRALPPACLSCFLTTFTDNTFVNVQKSCLAPISAQGTLYRRLNRPGLILLSGKPLVGPKYEDYHPATEEVLEKGYILAKVMDGDDDSSSSSEYSSSSDSDGDDSHDDSGDSSHENRLNDSHDDSHDDGRDESDDDSHNNSHTESNDDSSDDDSHDYNNDDSYDDSNDDSKDDSHDHSNDDNSDDDSHDYNSDDSYDDSNDDSKYDSHDHSNDDNSDDDNHDDNSDDSHTDSHDDSDDSHDNIKDDSNEDSHGRHDDSNNDSDYYRKDDSHNDSKDGRHYDSQNDSKDDRHDDSKDDRHDDSKDDRHGDTKDDRHDDSKDDSHGDSDDDSHDDSDENSKDDSHNDSKDYSHNDSDDESHNDSKDDSHDDSDDDSKDDSDDDSKDDSHNDSKDDSHNDSKDDSHTDSKDDNDGMDKASYNYSHDDSNYDSVDNDREGDNEDNGGFDVVCTHTTDYNTPIYFELGLMATGVTSFVQQGEIEINRLLLDFVEKDKLLLAGDFNAGPAVPGSNIVPVQKVFLDALKEAFDVEFIGQCTLCSAQENVFNGDIGSQMIDHIFYSGFEFKSKKRIFDDVKIDGKFPLSDHFGVQNEFRCPKKDKKGQTKDKKGQTKDKRDKRKIKRDKRKIKMDTARKRKRLNNTE